MRRLSLCLILSLACDSTSDGATKPAAEPKVESPSPTPAVAKTKGASTSTDATQPKAPDAKAPDAKTSDAKTVEPPPPAPVPAPSLTDQLAKLGDDKASAITQGIDLFVARYDKPAAPIDEDERFTSLTQLLEFIAATIGDPHAPGGLLASSGWIEPAACKRSGQCDAGPTDDDKLAALDALEQTGIKIVYDGEGTFMVEPNYGMLADRLAPALPPAGRDYLLALMWESEKVNALYDEGGFAGEPAFIEEALARWEALADDASPLYAKEAATHAATMAERYLRLCERPVQVPTCAFTKAHVTAYRRFVREYAGSRYQPSVAHLLTKAKPGATMGEAKIAAVVKESLAKARAAGAEATPTP